jgi:FAD/FMN-containing dehydrogenase/Fe-S oxidoreductase
MRQKTALARDMLQFCRKHLGGEAYFEPLQRWLYSTDASIYQEMPLGVIVPRESGDLDLALELARRYETSITPRGGGTSLGGQAIGSGLQVDLSKYFNRILEINPDAGWVRVQPGVILDQLNRALEPHGLWFGPDVAPSNRATLGGMIGNNSAGAHSIIYGKTIDHVLSLDVLLSDGSRSKLRELDARSWAVKCQKGNLEGQIYRVLSDSIEASRAEIEARFPKILRRVSGYNLDAFLSAEKRNLAHLMVGSEGGLCLIREAKLRVQPRPTHRGLLLIYCQDVPSALEANHAIIQTRPSAAELMDKMLLDLTRQSLAYSRKLYFMEREAPALLMVEYMGFSAEERDEKLQAGLGFAQNNALGFHASVSTDPQVQADIWSIRKAGMPLLYSRPGDHKPVTFIEDTAVAPEYLKDFIREFDSLVKAHDTQASYYAHASVGCLHIRPLLNLKDVHEVRKMRSLSEAVLELVQAYHGAMSGEHGDGYARSEFNEKLFGLEVYGIFQKIKKTCDPHNRLNPGKVVNAPPMDANLRYGEGYQPRPFDTAFAYTQQQSFQNLVELCNGCGGCRKPDTGIMCPPFQVTRNEADSTRGRANALRQLLIQPDLEGTEEQELYQIMDLCVGCKACKAECPSKVDMAKLKSEFLQRYQTQHGVPLRSRFFGHLKWLNHFGALTAPFSNQLLRSRLFRKLLEKGLGVDARKSLPPFAEIPLDYWFQLRQERQGVINPDGPVVALFNDCFSNYNHPEVGQAAIRLIEAFGYQVMLPPQVCCGRPKISLGLLHEAKRDARRVLKQYKNIVQAGIQVIGLEPSCTLSFGDEYPDYYPEASQPLAQQSLSLQEWLLQQAQAFQYAGKDLPFSNLTKQVFFHEHCHQRSLVGSEQSLKALRLAPQFEVEMSQAGCCGMAGSFGYESEHAELSRQIGAQRLFPQIQRSDAELGGSGISCRHQIESELGRPVRHLAEILAEALKDSL